jgi:hypothetical protein
MFVLAALVGSATLVAVATTICWAVAVAGAVYRPVVEIIPTFGLSVHVAAAFPDPPLTVAVNCWLWLGKSTVVDGVIATLIGETTEICPAWVEVATALPSPETA